MFLSKKQRAQMRKRKNKAAKKAIKNTNDEDANDVGESSSLPTAAEDNDDVEAATKKRRLNEETNNGSSSNSSSNIMVIKIPDDLTGKQAKKFRKEARREAKKSNPDIEITFISHDNEQQHEAPTATTITNPENNNNNNNTNEQPPDQQQPPRKRKPQQWPRINDILHQNHLLQKRQKLSSRLTSTLTPHERSLYVAIDCEMVGVGPSGKQSALARVSLTALDGAILLDSFVQVTERVVDYRTWVSGVKAKDVHPCKNPGALTFEACRKTVAGLIRGKVLVGHSLENDLKALMLNHPKESVRDTARYKPFMRRVMASRGTKKKLRPRKLKDLAKEFLGMEIQVEGKPHDSVEDARAVMELYKRVRFQWERDMEKKSQAKNGGGGKSLKQQDG